MTETVAAYRASRQQRDHLAGGPPRPVSCRVTIDQPVDAGRLRAAVGQATGRHEALRTVLRRTATPDRVVQQLLPVAAAWAWGPGELDAEHGPVLRALLDLPSSGGPAELVLTTYHRNADPVSLTTLVNEVMRAYAGDPPAGEAPVQYPQYAQWQHDLDATPPGPDLATRPGPALPYAIAGADIAGADQADGADRAYPVDLAADTRQALDQLDRDALAATVLAAWAGLLARLSGVTTVPLAVLSDGRSGPELDGAVGPYAQYLPVPVPVPAGVTGATLGEAVAAATVHARRWQDHPDAARPEADLPGFALVDLALPATTGGGYRVVDISCPPPAGPLSLVVERAGGRRLGVTVRLRESRFWPGSGEALADQVAAVLAHLVTRPHRPVDDADLFTARTRRLLDAVPTGDATPPAEPADVVGQVAAQVRQTPQRPAVADPGRALTYAQLGEESARLSAHLRERGARPGDLVAVCLDPGCDALVAILAIMRAGAAWLPIDPQWPIARTRRLLRDSGSSLLITTERLLATAGADATGTDVVCLDQDGWRGTPPGTGTPPDPSGDDLAYLMYTSGSTGAPKGVAVTHRGLGNYLRWARRAYRLSPETVSLVHSPLTFDLTVTSLLAPLTAGGRMQAAAAPGVEGLVRGLAEQRVTLLKLTPAHLRLLSRAAPPEHLAGLRAVVVGGEALTEEAVQPWRSLAPEALLVNEYGPTETVVGCCVHHDTGGSGRAAVPIGRPISDTRLYLLDRHGRRVGLGCVGELYVGGAGVAQGYHRAPAATAERFLPDPFGTGQRLYHTGDLARYLPSGELEYVGRDDDQVQILGYRVELGEVESVLGRHPDVAAAAAAVRLDPPRLCGYVVAASGARPAPAEVRGFLANRLPTHLVPASVTVVDALPMTGNGKVDRTRLPEPADPMAAPADRSAQPAADYQEPTGALEERICRIWASTLRVDHVGIHDNFFDLGGHSFLLVELAGRLQQEFGPAVTVLTLVEHPTVASLAAVLGSTGAPTTNPASPPGTASEPTGAQDGPSSRAELRRQAQAAARERNRSPR